MSKTRSVSITLAVTLCIAVAAMSHAAGSPDKNPYAGNPKMVKEGKNIYDSNCKSCHGDGGRGDICPNLTIKKKKYGNSDAELFTTIAKGRPGGMPNWNSNLGTEKIWKVITYLRSVEK